MSFLRVLLVIMALMDPRLYLPLALVPGLHHPSSSSSNAVACCLPAAIAGGLRWLTCCFFFSNDDPALPNCISWGPTIPCTPREVLAPKENAAGTGRRAIFLKGYLPDGSRSTTSSSPAACCHYVNCNDFLLMKIILHLPAHSRIFIAVGRSKTRYIILETNEFSHHKWHQEIY